MRLVEVYQDNVGALARLQAAHLVLQPQHSRPVHRRHLQNVLGCQHFGVEVFDFLQHGGHLHHLEEIVGVTGRAVGSQTHRHAQRAHLCHRRDAIAQVCVRHRAVRDLAVGLGDQLYLPWRQPHGVDEDGVRPGQADLVHVLQITHSVVLQRARDNLRPAGHVGCQLQPLLPRHLDGFVHQPVADVLGGARAEGDDSAPLLVPPINEDIRSLNQFVLTPDHRHILIGNVLTGEGLIKQTIDHVMPQACALENLGHPVDALKVVMQIPVVGDSRRAASDHLQGSNLRADLGVLWPNLGCDGEIKAPVPGVEVHVVANPLDERLVNVGVTVDQARANHTIRGVNHLTGLVACMVLHDGDDPALIHCNSAILNNATLWVHRDDRPASDNQINHVFPIPISLLGD